MENASDMPARSSCRADRAIHDVDWSAVQTVAQEVTHQADEELLRSQLILCRLALHSEKQQGRDRFVEAVCWAGSRWSSGGLASFESTSCWLCCISTLAAPWYAWKGNSRSVARPPSIPASLKRPVEEESLRARSHEIDVGLLTPLSKKGSRQRAAATSSPTSALM